MDGYRVTLTFIVDSETEAWELAEVMETGAMKRKFRECSSWVTAIGESAREFLVDEGQTAIETSAVAESRGEFEPTMIGGMDGQGVTLGGEHGESG